VIFTAELLGGAVFRPIGATELEAKERGAGGSAVRETILMSGNGEAVGGGEGGTSMMGAAWEFLAMSWGGGTGPGAGFASASDAPAACFFATGGESALGALGASTRLSVLVPLAWASVTGGLVLVRSGAGSTVCLKTSRGENAGTARYAATTRGNRIITPKSTLRLFQHMVSPP